MWFRVILFFIYFCSSYGYDFDEDIEILKDNMYENLKAFPGYEISNNCFFLRLRL